MEHCRCGGYCYLALHGAIRDKWVDFGMAVPNIPASSRCLMVRVVLRSQRGNLWDLVALENKAMRVVW